MLTRADIVLGLRDLGLHESDFVLVHSACSKLGPIDGGVATVLLALREILSFSGTLVVPTFTFESRGGPSEMGALTRLVQEHPLASSVFHPVHSFACLGHLAQRLGQIRNVSSYGPDSLFANLTEADGKILIMGLSYNDSMTYFHYVEQSAGVPYREIQDLGEGYTIYGRKDGVATSVDPMGEILEAAGVVNVVRLGEADCKIVRARDVFRITTEHLRDIPSPLHVPTR